MKRRTITLVTSSYYDDPDGNRYEFQSDNFATVAECVAFFRGPSFRENPIGVNFDPEYLCELLYQGAPETELMHQGQGTPPGREVVGGRRAITWRTL